MGDSYIRDIKRAKVPPPVHSARDAGRLRRFARFSLVLGLALGLLGLGFYAGADHPETASVGYATAASSALSSANLTVNATDAPPYFSPGNLTVVEGVPTEVVVHNLGSFDRTFTLSKVANFTIPRSDSPQALDAFFAANGSFANVSIPAGATAYANLSFPTADAGSAFEFVSLVPYQFQAGALGFVHVGYSTSAGTFQLSVQTTDSLSFVPDTLVLPNATTYPVSVSVEVTNAGSTQHTFWIEGQDNNSLNPANFSTYFTSHPPLADVNVPTTPGAPVWANFTITGKGAFEFICTVPGHFRLPTGMYGWLYVGWVPTPPPPPPSSAIVDTAFLAGAGVLLAVGVLLTVVATFGGRFPRQPSTSSHH